MTKQDKERFIKIYELLKAKDTDGIGEMTRESLSGENQANTKTMWERLNSDDKEYVLCDLIINFPFEVLDLLNDKEDEKLLEWALKRQAELTFEKMKLERINEREKRQHTKETTKESKQWKN